jgi:hypothetical protein
MLAFIPSSHALYLLSLKFFCLLSFVGLALAGAGFVVVRHRHRPPGPRRPPPATATATHHTSWWMRN